MNAKAMPYSSRRLPRTGMSNSSQPRIEDDVICTKPMSRKGTSLPSIRLGLSIGVTMSCSSVPRSPPDDRNAGDEHHGHVVSSTPIAGHDAHPRPACQDCTRAEPALDAEGRAREPYGDTAARAAPALAAPDIALDDAMRVGRVHDDLRLRRAAALDVALVVRRDHQGGARHAALDGVAQGGSVGHRADEVEVPGVDHHRHERAALRRARFVEHDGLQVPHVGLDRVAEEHELNRGQAGHHRKREPVAAHLDELLPEHRPEAGFTDPRDEVHAAAPSSRRCSSMNTSSIVGCSNCARISFTVPRPMRWPRERNASRWQRSASSM